MPFKHTGFKKYRALNVRKKQCPFLTGLIFSPIQGNSLSLMKVYYFNTLK